MLSATGVSPDIEVVQEAYYVARDRILRACRVSDLTIVTRSDPISGLERDLTEELLFSSGRPLLLVPPNAPNQATLDVVSLAWDGGERAARAAGDAAALLPPSARIEVVCVAGDRDKTKQAAGWDICRNLARHFTAATVATVEADDGGVSAAILAQAKASGASLLVMGGYGHSRFRQVVLGGVTHDMIASAPIPVLLSY
jgi:nucleotide-binding universal stress UspA family protein